MAPVIENYSKFEIRLVVRLLQAEGVIQREIHRRLVIVYGKKVSTRGRTPEKHRGRPRSEHNDENCVTSEV
jgi:hypothetical protein